MNRDHTMPFLSDCHTCNHDRTACSLHLIWSLEGDQLLHHCRMWCYQQEHHTRKCDKRKQNRWQWDCIRFRVWFAVQDVWHQYTHYSPDFCLRYHYVAAYYVQKGRTLAVTMIVVEVTTVEVATMEEEVDMAWQLRTTPMYQCVHQPSCQAIWGAKDLGTILEYLAPRWRYSVSAGYRQPGNGKRDIPGFAPGNQQRQRWVLPFNQCS